MARRRGFAAGAGRRGDGEPAQHDRSRSIWCCGCCSTSAVWDSRCGGASPLLLAGVGIAAIGSLRAALADTLHKVLSVGSLHQFGMATMALGVALFARAVDLPSVASRALAAAWLALVCHMLCRTLLLMCADAVESGAGTRRLDLMGGLLHRMPITAGCCLVGLFTVAVLPPGLGFAAFWLLFQSLIAAARIGDFGVQLLVLVVAALTALSVGLMALATVRLFGVVFIGRPRTPRTAVAEEAPRPVRLVLIGLAASLGLLGLLPALVLLPTIGWTHARFRSMAGVEHRRRGCWVFAHCCCCTPGTGGIRRVAPIAPPRRTAARTGMVGRICRATAVAAIRRSGDPGRSCLLRRTAARCAGVCCHR